MSDEGSCVTLIFYRINPKWWKEPALNLASAVCQMSNLTHCEISLGEDAGGDGQTMKHVARVFNDSVGVELVERTGRNPQNLFIQLGCSKAAEYKMLHYVRTQCVGKPFSNYAMVRSLVWPRETDHSSFFCAELVASILKVGGLLDANCNPGSATPEMLHRIYAARGAASANPCILREINGSGNAAGMSTFIGNLTASERLAECEALIASTSAHGTPGVQRQMSMTLPVAPPQPLFQPARRRASSPPRGHFHAVNRDYVQLGASRAGPSGGGACSSRCVTTGGIQLTMDSLKFGGTRCKVHPR